ncbi:hypothetical protein A8924_0055 [Saccharopolyspora erythraea NRRL 2338]|uniref:Uncharacterized protein n=2 Tax=Saccharopolyspora erythraea TaxID=1836 RepID=A4FQB1_SACEN|nr:hypothetical protein [Saccharopolyspora erythraea]EQD86317.1 hypothetical protein N599_10215 [Saccharopolyspora erythraea D]PFG92836.1 hypothetical protein A8924_0055 [Saccharopolyspora erythraea NRRL 2338]QRK89748.1 hypothetical protein JQX30_35435 [Saccharopolyspora erythraea]CAM06236.1 hypothetical protein SACE_7075 [Saccharopolyspora erythraea NRRL 2338]
MIDTGSLMYPIVTLLVLALIMLAVARLLRPTGRPAARPKLVYLIEDHTDQARTTRYWAHVHLSREKAKAEVEESAARSGHEAVRWEDRSAVLHAFADGSDGTDELYRVVSLEVRPEDEVLI